MYLSKLHVQEGKQLSWIPFLLYFTHGSYDLIGEGGLSQLAYGKILSLSFPRTASDLDASTKGWSLTKVWNKPLAHMESSYLKKSSHRNQEMLPNLFPHILSPQQLIFKNMWFSALPSY